MKYALTVLLLSTALWGQLYSSGGPVVNNVGQPVAAQIAVCTTSPTIIVAPNHPPDCAVFAQTYSDATLGTPCTLSPSTLGPISGTGCTNPGKTDSRGNYVVFAPSNVYYLEFYGYGITTYIMPASTATTAGNFASPPPIGNVTPNTGQFTATTVLNQATDNPACTAAGLGIYINGGLSPCNIAAHDVVALGSFINSGGSTNYSIWGFNTGANVTTGHDTSAVGVEIDLANYGTDQASLQGTNPKNGLQIVNTGYTGGKQGTAAVVGLGGFLTAGWHHLLSTQAGHFSDDLLQVSPLSIMITQAITGSGSPQTVTANSSASWPLVGSWITLDSTTSQEDVQLTAVTSGSITGIFTKNHVINTSAAFYASTIGLNFKQSIFRQSPLVLGDLQYTVAAGTPHYPAIGLVNLSGTLVNPILWDTSGLLHIRDVASGFGIAYENSSGTNIAGLDDSGNFTVTQGLFGNSVTIGSAIFHGSSSGTVTVTAQAAAGTPAIMWPTQPGTVMDSVGTPLALNATTGQVSCPTCAITAAPTVGQAACIYAAGPPVQIGKCTSVVSAGGACTCAP